MNIYSKDGFKSSAVVTSNWLRDRDANGNPQIQSLMEEQTVNLAEPSEFRFKIPLKNNNQRLLEFAVLEGNAPVALQHLVVRGRLAFFLGVAFADQGSGVTAEKVLPNGLGEKVGIKPGDRFLSINGQTPKTTKEAMELIKKIQFGERAQIAVQRGGKKLNLDFTAE